jgi:hypothetical protein
MRIVSWNRKKIKSTNISPDNFGKMLKLVLADLVLLQEGNAVPRATGWTFTAYDGGNGQDQYAVGLPDGSASKVESCSLQDDPRKQKLGQGKARKFILLRIKTDDQVISIVTCHAPDYGGNGGNSSDEAVEYMTALGAYMATWKVDLFMGDVNIRESFLEGGEKWAPKGWLFPPLGSTTGHGSGKGSPLDRIVVNPGSKLVNTDNKYWGRIYSAAAKPGPAPNAKGFQDIVLPRSKEAYLKVDPATLWDISDHLAIYFDTGSGSVARKTPGSEPEEMDTGNKSGTRGGTPFLNPNVGKKKPAQEDDGELPPLDYKE